MVVEPTLSLVPVNMVVTNTPITTHTVDVRVVYRADTTVRVIVLHIVGIRPAQPMRHNITQHVDMAATNTPTTILTAVVQGARPLEPTGVQVQVLQATIWPTVVLVTEAVQAPNPTTAAEMVVSLMEGRPIANVTVVVHVIKRGAQAQVFILVKDVVDTLLVRGGTIHVEDNAVALHPSVNHLAAPMQSVGHEIV